MESFDYLARFDQALGLSAGLVFVYMNLWFVASLLRRRADIVDVAWGGGFMVIALGVFAMRLWLGDTGPWLGRPLLVLGLVLLWGGRLAWHIGRRNLAKKEEDFRYRQWREEWGKTFVWRSYLQVFLLQGFILLAVSGSVLLIEAFPQGPLGWLDGLGLLLWGLGFGFEAVGDAQLAQFKQDPANKGKIIQSGLWRYTRHPNYFGEVTLWWGLYLLALSVPYGAWSILAPLTISFFILKVSGIPMLEAKYAGRPDFEAYKARTNAFFPWFPR